MTSRSQAQRDRLYEEGLCWGCGLPLLDEERSADAVNCGVRGKCRVPYRNSGG